MKQALFTINIDNIIFADNKLNLLPNKALKHTNLIDLWNHLHTISMKLKKNYAL